MEDRMNELPDITFDYLPINSETAKMSSFITGVSNYHNLSISTLNQFAEAYEKMLSNLRKCANRKDIPKERFAEMRSRVGQLKPIYDSYLKVVGAQNE
jgi:hypothetical protein